MADILIALDPLIRDINRVMADLLALDEEVVACIGQYNFEGGGKRLRPLIFCLMCQALGSPLNPEVLKNSVSFEFLHMATLLHDDIVDGAETRRGRQAAHLVFCTAEVVLAGDYFLAKAASITVATSKPQCMEIMTEVVATMSLGELIQLKLRHKSDLSEKQYFEIIYRKTAVLLEGAAKSAAVYVEATPSIVDTAALYGRQLGLAFQIMDDILDYQGDPDVFGKPVGHDLDEGKITLPFILARENLPPKKRARLMELAAKSSISDVDYVEISALVDEGKGVLAAREKALELVKEAVSTLYNLPCSLSRDHLEALVTFTVDRDN